MKLLPITIVLVTNFAATANASNYLHRECILGLHRAYSALESLKETQGEDIRTISAGRRHGSIPPELTDETMRAFHEAQDALEAYIDAFSIACEAIRTSKKY